jgi:hypothetical protein
MIKQDIMYLPIDDQFTIGLNCTIQTLAVYEHNKMKAEVGLSPMQNTIMQLFFNHFPYFLPDKVILEVLYSRTDTKNQLAKNVSRVLTQLRSRIEPLDLKIKRINQTGYLLEGLNWTTRSPDVNLVQTV